MFWEFFNFFFCVKEYVGVFDFDKVWSVIMKIFYWKVIDVIFFKCK